MGLAGDQRLNFSQNKTLAESHSNGVDLFLFEVFEQGKYVFQGEIQLVDNLYQEEQTDINGNLWKV